MGIDVNGYVPVDHENVTRSIGAHVATSPKPVNFPTSLPFGYVYTSTAFAPRSEM